MQQGDACGDGRSVPPGYRPPRSGWGWPRWAGPSRAEDFLGGWLDDHPDRAARMTVGSKWGYTYTGGWQLDPEAHEVKDHSLATFERQAEQTRTRLGGHLDLYQIHSATLAPGVLDDEEVLAALRGLAAEGIVVGLTLSGPHQARTLEHALERAQDGHAP